MPRTYRNLWPRVVAWGNLSEAYRKARRRKRYRPDVAAFETRRVENLLRLQRLLAEGRWRPGGYRHFMIRRPKERRISAAPFADRVVHHAIVNVLEPLFERKFVYDSYACRVGKGTHRALRRAHGFLRARAYVLQGDIRRFFPSVDHEVLMGVVARTVRDERVLDLLRLILQSGVGVLDDQAPGPWFPGDDLFAALRPRGLPIGNLTSQFLANVLLDVFDHFVAEQVRPAGYVRYCDDFLLFDDDRDRLKEAKTAVQRRLDQLRLHLHGAKTFVKPTFVGIHFLGFRMKQDGLRLPQSSLRRANARLRYQARQLARGTIDKDRVGASVRAWAAHTEHGKTCSIREALLHRNGLEWAVR